METKNEINYTKVILVVLFVLVIVLNIIMYIKGFYKINVETVMYKENNSINYRVYYKKNNFFEEKSKYMNEKGEINFDKNLKMCLSLLNLST